MSQNNQNDLKIIHGFIELLKEEDLYDPLRRLLLSQGYDAWIVHGSHERGKDIIATKKKEHTLLLSVKRGDIDQKRWKTEVKPSLDEMMMRSIQHTNVDESLPRRPLLVLNGEPVGSVDPMVVEFNEFYKKKGEPELEVWDINRLAEKFNTHLLSVDLLGEHFLEDLQRLVISITPNDINSNYIQNFVNKHTSLDVNRFVAFRLATLYVLRRSEHQDNIYAFFKFAELTLVKVWSLIHSSNNAKMLSTFDDLHNIYLESLKGWSTQMKDAFQKDSGLFDFNTNGALEIITFPLWAFDTIRRLSYIAYYHLLKMRIF